MRGTLWLFTLWLCQNSYWTWPFIVDFPINSMVIFHSFLYVYQRVTYLWKMDENGPWKWWFSMIYMFYMLYNHIYIYRGFLKWGGPKVTIVVSILSHDHPWLGWFGGTAVLGNLHVAPILWCFTWKPWFWGTYPIRGNTQIEDQHRRVLGAYICLEHIRLIWCLLGVINPTTQSNQLNHK